jgi:hypothetical protein
VNEFIQDQDQLWTKTIKIKIKINCGQTQTQSQRAPHTKNQVSVPGSLSAMLNWLVTSTSDDPSISVVSQMVHGSRPPDATWPAHKDYCVRGPVAEQFRNNLHKIEK